MTAREKRGDIRQLADAVESLGIDTENGQIAVLRTTMVFNGSRSRNCSAENCEGAADTATTVFVLGVHDINSFSVG